MPFPARPAENADPWYDEREVYDQAIEDAITAEHDSDGVHNLDAIADGTTKKLMTATERTKLATVEARANHTGTQLAATISDLSASVSANTDVVANTAARHTHANSAVLAATTASFLTADETKLDGIATGATANATNAELRTRSSHTGTQLASTISDFASTVSAVTDVVNNTAARHTHANKAILDTYTQTETNLADAVTKKHAHANSAVLDATTASFLTADETKLDAIEALADVTDAANVSAAGALMTSAAPELIRDTIGTALVAGGGIGITVNDGSDTITVAQPPLQRTGITPIIMIDNRIVTGAEFGRGAYAQADTFDVPTTTIALMDFYVPYAISIDALGVNVGTLDAGGTLRLGLFQMSADGSTHTLLVDAGTVDTDTAVAKQATFTAVPVAEGWYQAGVTRSAADTAIRIRSFSPAIKVYGGFNGTSYNITSTGGYRTIAHAGGAATPFTSSYGASTNDILAATCPAIFLRIQT
jgi:hypothetical protein